jgi:hypothetical protein
MLRKKSLLNKIQTVTLISTTIVGCWFSQATKTLALPQEQINQKLGQIFVFTISTEKGEPLVGKDDKSGKLITPIFIAKKEAETFIADLKKKNPDALKDKSIQPTNLLTIYNEAFKEKPGITFQFIGQSKEIQEAKKLNPQYQGVPLFAIFSENKPLYLTIKNEKNEEIEFMPIFFEKERGDVMIAEMKKKQPNLANDAKIQVIIPLEIMLERLNKGNEDVAPIEFIPSKDSVQVLNDILKQQELQPQKPAQQQQQKKK